MDSAGDLKCYGYGLESSMAGHLEKSSVHWSEELGIGMYGERYTGRKRGLGNNFF